MADFAINIILKSRNEASGAIRQVLADTRALEKAGKPKGKGKALGGASLSEAAGAFQQLGGAAKAAVGTPIQLAAEFEAAVNRINALSGGKFAMGPELAAISNKARELGKATEFTATQAAEGFQLLTQAGFSYEEQLASIEHVLNFATIGQVDMATSADLLANALGGFGLKGTEAERVANAMTRASLASQIELQHLGESFKYAAPQAAQLGFSVEETATALAVLGKAGVRGSMGGTALRAFFNRLATATGPLASKKQLEAMQMLGIDRAQLKKAIESGDLASVPKYLADAMSKKKMSKAEKVAALQGLFTERGGLGAAILIRAVERDTSALTEAERKMFEAMEIDPSTFKTDQLGSVWDEVEAAMNDSGVTMAKTASEIRTGTKNSVTVLNSALEELGITVGEKLLPVITPLIEDITRLTGKFAEWANENPELVKALGRGMLAMAAFGLAAGPVLTTLSSVGTILKITGAGFAGLAPAVGPATKAIGAFFGTTVGAIVGAAAAGVGIGMLIDHFFGLSDAIAGVNREYDIYEGHTGGKAVGRKTATLGSLTEEEQASLRAAQAKHEAARVEIEEAGFFEDDDAARERMRAALDEMNAINAIGVERGKGIKGLRESRKAIDETVASSMPSTKIDPSAKIRIVVEEKKAPKVEQLESGDIPLAVETGIVGGESY